MKKITAVFLCIFILSGLFIPSVSAAQEYYSETPIIMLHGLGSDVIGRDGQYEYNGTDKLPAIISDEEFLKTLGSKLLVAYATDDWQDYADFIYDSLTPCFANTQLDENGEASYITEGSTFEWSWDYSQIKGKTKKYTASRYNYYIDWRLDPMYIAKDFSDYVDAVLKKTGAEKAKLVVRCMGTNVLLSYLAMDEKNYDKFTDICLYIPANRGIDYLGAIFTGKMAMDNASTRTYLNYLLSSAEIDDEIKSFAESLIAVLDYLEIMGFAVDEVNNIVENVRDILLPRLVMNSFGTYPGFWSLVGDEYYSDAVDFIFSYEDYAERYAGLIEKIENYDKTVRCCDDELILKAQEKGINVSVIAKYNKPIPPFTEGCEFSGDGTSSLSDISLGATSGVCFEQLSEKYISAMSEEDKKYLSPDKMIDASTCLLPETTWFIKDNLHGNQPSNLYYFMNYILSDNVTSEKITVFTDTTNWGQFLGYNAQTNEIIPLVVEEDEDKSVDDNSPWKVFVNFLTNIFNLLTKVLNGELMNNQ